MFPSNIPPEGRGAISLQAYVYIKALKEYKKCIIIEACSVTQSAVVVVLGSLFMQSVPFRNIANVALVYDDSTVAKSFGAPRASRPESLEFIPNFDESYTEGKI
jgi:hypothetical protein